MTIGEARRNGAAALKAAHLSGNADIPLADLDASLLLGYVLGLSRAALIAHDTDSLAPEAQNTYEAALQRRATGTCVAYITGEKEFFGLSFYVTESVLVPRPETEILAEAALNCLKTLQTERKATSLSASDSVVRVLDLCTGSGCLAITLKHQEPTANVWASDISIEALTIAKKNAQKLLGAADALNFVHSDLFSTFPNGEATRFDIIVSNPPYVCGSCIEALSPELHQEPRLALDGGGEDGLDLIRRLIPQAFSHLTSGGYLLLESGGEQVQSILSLMEKAGFTHTRFLPDLAGIPRVSIAQRP